jgi:ABC-type phosphate transport system substrate-binding protein
MSNTIRNIAFLGLASWALLVQGEMVVVVNLQSGVDLLTKSQVINIFLGNHREFPNGLAAKPVDLPAVMPDKGQFYRSLVNKDLDQMAAYWSRLVFAGNTQPPVQANSTQDMLQAVATQRNAIGYVDRKSVDPTRVKVVLALP